GAGSPMAGTPRQDRPGDRSARLAPPGVMAGYFGLSLPPPPPHAGPPPRPPGGAQTRAAAPPPNRPPPPPHPHPPPPPPKEQPAHHRDRKDHPGDQHRPPPDQLNQTSHRSSVVSPGRRRFNRRDRRDRGARRVMITPTPSPLPLRALRALCGKPSVVSSTHR